MSEGRITLPNRITLPVDGEALKPPPRFAGWTNMVAQNCIQAIAIAPRSGLMWLATYGGILSWDRDEGRVYRRYSSEHGLAGNAVACLCVDQIDRPWVGHLEGGLSYFEDQYWQAYGHLLSDPIRAVCSGEAAGGIWAATSDTVYYIAHPGQSPVTVAQELDGAVEVSTMLADGDGVLLGNMWGLFRLEHGRVPQPVLPAKIGDCTALARDTANRVWIGTSSQGVYRLQGDNVVNGPLASSSHAGRVVELAAGRDRIWVLTASGLAQISEDKWATVKWFPHDTDSPPPVRTIAPSSQDEYAWIGTDEGLGAVSLRGPNEAIGAFKQLPEHADDELNNLGRCIVEGPKESVWIGTAGGLVTSGVDSNCVMAPEAGDVRALCVAARPAGHRRLWLLSWPWGLVVRKPDGRLHFLPLNWPPGVPLALATGKDEYAYVLTGQGLWKMGSGGPEKVAIGPSVPPLCLAQTPDDTWWLGSAQGIYRHNKLGNSWELVGDPGGPWRAGIHALAIVQDTMWVAADGGLWAWQNNSWTRHNPVPTQSPVRSVRAVAAASTQGTLWLACDDGILRYDPDTGSTQSYTTADSGLASHRVMALLESAGTLWIVTQAGISRLNLQVGEGLH